VQANGFVSPAPGTWKPPARPSLFARRIIETFFPGTLKYSAENPRPSPLFGNERRPRELLRLRLEKDVTIDGDVAFREIAHRREQPGRGTDVSAGIRVVNDLTLSVEGVRLGEPGEVGGVAARELRVVDHIVTRN